MLKTQFLSILAFVLLSVIHAKATNYYINSNVGKDSNQGTSKGSPWKGFANLEKNRYFPGDSILFANGTSYIGNQIHDHNLYFSVDNGADPLGGIPKGDGDIIANPGFVDFVNRNFRLKRNSPAINAGIQSGYKLDIDGRHVDGRPDIDAFEF